jgi:hypothetical protein
MDLDLGPEHVLLRQTIRDFMTGEVAPVIDCLLYTSPSPRDRG